MSDDFYFSPDDDALTPLLAAVEAAQTSILIADYSWTLPGLTALVIAKAKAGVSVRMVLDKSQSSGKSEAVQVQLLKNAGVDLVIGTSDKHQIMHLKCMVVDNSTVVFGSYNFTTSAQLESNVLAVFEDDSALATLFTQQIEKVYAWIVQNEPVSLSLSLGKEKYMNFFQGYRTYIVAVVAAVFNLLVATNAISAAHLAEINIILAAFGITALHSDVTYAVKDALAKLSK